MVAEMSGPLHLRAEDPDDLAVVSSFLQDALVPLADMHFDRAARRFVLAVNRFRWEASRPDAGRDAVYERIASAVTFEEVSAVNLHGLDRKRRDRMLELLAVMTGERPEAPGAIILLVFAGGGRIRLSTERIRCRIEDFGEPWPTRWRPRHETDPGER